MRRIPAIKSVMTAFPYSVDIDAPIAEASEFFQKHDIHHLPVTENDELVGVLTARGISFYLETAKNKKKKKDVIVRDAYVNNAYVVDLNERLDKVLQTMAERHIGSALVTRRGKLAGVFTVSDACSNFAKYLREQFKPPEGNDAA